MFKRPVALMIAVLAAFVLVVGACSSDSSSDTTTTSKATETSVAASTLSGAVTISAAASLTGSFEEIQKLFVAEHPDVTVTFNFGASGALAEQIQQGAPADVAAFADTTPMDKLVAASLIDGEPQIFAHNQLVIVTKPGNPEKITTVADLVNAGTVSLCGASAPCGKFADQILATAGVTIPETSVTRGQDVKATLAAVTQGDANAAIVYTTDAKSVGDQVETVEIPEPQNVIADYPIASVKASTNAEAAKAFIDFVLGPEGQKVLVAAGFLPAKG